MFFDMIQRAGSDGSDFEYEHRLQMPDQSVKYLHLVAHGFRDQNGALEYIGAVQDITRRRLAEEALGRARTELAHVARVMTLGTLTASIAHEVSQPVLGIITNSNTCLRMLAANPPDLDGARETVRRTLRDGSRASDIITRLRALFANKGVAMKSIDLNDATREVIALSLSELQRSRVVVQMELADDLPSVTGDRVQLQQVILNLVMNGVDAVNERRDGPRSLVISTGTLDTGEVTMTVRDSGVGVDPAVFDKLFDPFFTTKPEGMGMGLSVSRSIVESHGGRLWASINDGPGASFHVTLPARA
jgi:C4-dicarboxylate-specific signal transduction histidine kinase